MNAIDFLYDYFLKHGGFQSNDREVQLSADFFENGQIDSFGIIDLISDIEAYFNIRFRPEDLQDNRFRTIKGLSDIIEAARKDKLT